MPGFSYVNPFTPQTPVGAGLQNIALALFAGKQNGKQNELNDSHMAYYDAQARKADAEAESARRRSALYTPEAIDEAVAASFAVPPSRVRELRTLPAPGSTIMPPATPFLPNARAIGERLLAVRTAMANKSDPASVALADQRFNATRRRDDVIEGELDPRRVAQAFFATSGKAPYAGGETGSTDLMTGAQQLNDVGMQRAGRERAQARNFTAQAVGHEGENASGVKMGAPVVIDSEAGPVFAPPRAAVGQRPGLNPNSAAARPPAAHGGAALKPPKEYTVTPSQVGQFDEEINAQLGVRADKQGQPLSGSAMPLTAGAQTRARARAIELYRRSGDLVASVQKSLQELGELEPETEPGRLYGTNETGRRKPKVAVSPPAETPKPPATAGKAPPRPAGKSDDQLIAEANEAIRAGRDRNVVMQRLQAWGVQVQ